MILCLVTDRRRLGRSLGVGPEGWPAAVESQVSAAVAAGIDLVQLREPDLDAGALTRLARALARLVAGSGTKLLVNDRLDVALAAGADGVHLPERSFHPDTVRALARHVGYLSCSTHSVSHASTVRHADLIIAGTVMATPSKPNGPLLGFGGLTAVVAAVHPVPVLGIGGLDRGSLSALRASGAAGLAAIGAFIPAPGGHSMAEFVKKRVEELRFGFDSLNHSS